LYSWIRPVRNLLHCPADIVRGVEVLQVAGILELLNGVEGRTGIGFLQNVTKFGIVDSVHNAAGRLELRPHLIPDKQLFKRFVGLPIPLAIDLAVVEAGVLQFLLEVHDVPHAVFGGAALGFLCHPDPFQKDSCLILMKRC
jgi:hypothetical protein